MCVLNGNLFFALHCINPDNITQDYIYVCNKKFFDDHCEFDSALVRINFTDFTFVQNP